MKRLTALALGTALIAATLALGTAAPASAAGLPTVTSFVGTAAVSAPFGSAWDIPIRVTSKSDEGTYNVTTNDGTVDIFVEGMPGEYVTAATIYPGGMVYFAQPSNEPSLPAGEYNITAVFTPAAGSDYATSKTKKAAVLTITTLAVTASAEILTDPAIVTVPTVRTSLAGQYVDEEGAPPSGTWTVTGTASTGDEAFSITAEQPTESAEGAVGPLDIPIPNELEPGETYDVTTTFTADPLIAAGLDYENPANLTFSTPSLTTAEVLSGPVDISLWIIMLNGVLFIVFVVILVLLLGVWTRGRPKKVKTAAAVPEPVLASAIGVGAGAGLASIESAESWSLQDEASDTEVLEDASVADATVEDASAKDASVDDSSADSSAEDDEEDSDTPRPE